MDPALSNLGWTEDQWNRICSVVSEEAQRARVCAQALPIVGLDDPSASAIPSYGMGAQTEPYPFTPASSRLSVNSDPDLYITTISVNVPLRSQDLSDPELRAALTMFRRAANYVARIEDTLVFNGRLGPDLAPPGIGGIPAVYRVTGGGAPQGLFPLTPPGGRIVPTPLPPPGPTPTGEPLFQQIVDAIGLLEGQGATGPFACLLSHELFNLICTPAVGLVLPRDRVLPFLQGPLLRSSRIPANTGLVVALGGSPVELVIASDINVRYLQTTPEPRYMFRVSERVALRIKETDSIALLG